MVRNVVAETIRRKSIVLTQKSKARKQVKGKSFNSKFKERKKETGVGKEGEVKSFNSKDNNDEI